MTRTSDLHLFAVPLNHFSDGLLARPSDRSPRILMLVLAAFWSAGAWAQTPLPESPDFVLQTATITHHESLGLLEWTLEVRGRVGGSLPQARGQVDGAPVLGYVFPTTLPPRVAGFGTTEGILALAVTSHPDFDDTPLWDENADGTNDNDGLVLHTHWVVLAKDERLDGGLAVREIKATAAGESKISLPATHPGMPLLLDSPGFPVRAEGAELQVVLPIERVQSTADFRFDAVTAYMEVNQSDPKRPTLGVYKVYSILSGDLSLPYRVKKK